MQQGVVQAAPVLLGEEVMKTYYVELKKRYEGEDEDWRTTLYGVIPIEADNEHHAHVQVIIRLSQGLQTVDERILWDDPIPKDMDYVDFTFETTGEVYPEGHGQLDDYIWNHFTQECLYPVPSVSPNQERLREALLSSPVFLRCPESVRTLVDSLVYDLADRWEDWDSDSQFCFVKELLHQVFGLPVELEKEHDQSVS